MSSRYALTGRFSVWNRRHAFSSPRSLRPPIRVIWRPFAVIPFRVHLSGCSVLSVPSVVSQAFFCQSYSDLFRLVFTLLGNWKFLDGCPTWIRTMTKASKGLCATVTPSDKPERKYIPPRVLQHDFLRTSCCFPS